MLRLVIESRELLVLDCSVCRACVCQADNPVHCTCVVLSVVFHSRAFVSQVASVAAAPNHTMVLLQVSRPSLPHDASSASSTSRPSGEKVNADNVSDNEGDLDSEGDGDDDEEAARRSESPARTPGGILTRNSSGALEPLTLKQHCEIVLAREVDLRNAASLLAYADALDAPALVEFCAEFVSSNLDGILVMGRDSDRTCLLETSGALVSCYAGVFEGFDCGHATVHKHGTLCSKIYYLVLLNSLNNLTPVFVVVVLMRQQQIPTTIL